MENETALLANDQRLMELNEQFNTLMRLVEYWMQRSPANAGSNQPDAARTHALLADFKSFFTNYYAYFVKRLAAGDFADQRTPVEVLRIVIRHVFEQGTTLSRLLSERRYGSLYRDHLLEADKQAKKYYDQYHGAKPGHNEPLVYFEKLYDITRFPFRPPPLIAIPLVDWDRPPWLSLAHELGHHVFWNSADLAVYRRVQDGFRTVLEECLKTFLALAEPEVITAACSRWLAWLEESFADIFATLVAGPDYAREAQDRLLWRVLNNAEDLLLDDGEHPMPAIRPLIASETLKHIPGCEEIAEILKKRWEPYLTQAQEVYVRDSRDMPKKVPTYPSPDMIAKMVPIVVQCLLKEPVLQAEEGKDELQPLIHLVQPWQPDASVFNAAMMIEQLSKDLPRLPSKPPFQIALPENVEEERQAVVAQQERQPELLLSPQEEKYTTGIFQRLRDYVRREIAEKRERRSEWETLLSLDLAPSSPQDHTDCQTHWHSLWHTHNYYNQVICC